MLRSELLFLSAMRYALISDVHGNLPALESVLVDIDRRGDVGGIFHLGDLVGYGPWPDEVVELIQERGIAGVAGNYDTTVAHRYDHCGCRYETPEQEALASRSFSWTVEAVEPETRKYLADLPFRIDLRPFGGHRAGPSVVLIHGAPTLNTLYWTEDRSADFCGKMIAAAGLHRGDVICFGHTHLPWHREEQGVHLLNTGSVGRPKDGDPRAGYAILTIETEAISVEFARVDYDVQRVVEAIERRGLPGEFGAHLQTGGARVG